MLQFLFSFVSPLLLGLDRGLVIRSDGVFCLLFFCLELEQLHSLVLWVRVRTICLGRAMVMTAGNREQYMLVFILQSLY